MKYLSKFCKESINVKIDLFSSACQTVINSKSVERTKYLDHSNIHSNVYRKLINIKTKRAKNYAY